MTTDAHTIYLLLPVIILIGAATLIYMLGAFRVLRGSASWSALVGLILAAGALFAQDDGLKQELWQAQEPTAKYFFLSILSSAILLYGFSFLYGAGGSTRLARIAEALTVSGGQESLGASLVPLAVLLMFAGLAFRLTAVPFHFYAPDVY